MGMEISKVAHGCSQLYPTLPLLLKVAMVTAVHTSRLLFCT
jgi:hypothetical protein